jgi:4-hydroxybenzoate polyprenyltransferase
MNDALHPSLPSWKVIPAALRVNQWTKNSVVLAAVFFAMGDREQRLGAGAVAPVLSAAFLFCLVSSAIYLINDMRDVESDRRHPLRAAGCLSPRHGSWPPHCSPRASAGLSC